jgi:short-subunit dehydrogenase
MSSSRPLALVTGASTGIGYELAVQCAKGGFDLVVVANESRIEQAAAELRTVGGGDVHPVQADLSTTQGNDKALAVAAQLGRPMDALLANAGAGLGDAFLDQDWDGVRHIIDTNMMGTTYLLQKVGREMRARDSGRILITGSIAGFIPGAFQAIYNASKAYVNSLSFALREELRDTNVTVTLLEPGATDTAFFERAGMLDTNVGQAKKDDPAMVAEAGFKAMMKGSSDITSGLKNKALVAVANVVPDELLAKAHRSMAEPK